MEAWDETGTSMHARNSAQVGSSLTQILGFVTMRCFRTESTLSFIIEAPGAAV